MTNQATRNRLVIEMDLLNNNGHKPVSDLTARTAKSATILKSTLSQSDTDLFNEQMLDKSIEQRKQILENWLDVAELDLIAQSLRDDAQAYGANIASKVAWRLRYNGNLEIAKLELNGLAASYPQLAERISKLDIMTTMVSRPAIYELAKDALVDLRGPGSQVEVYKSIYLIAVRSGAILTYDNGKVQEAVVCAYQPTHLLVWDRVWSLTKEKYQDWVARCKNAQPTTKSALDSLPETRLGGLSPRAQKAMRR